MAVVTVVAWAFSYPWAKAVLTWLEPIPAAAARYGLAAILLLAITLFGGKLLKVFRGNWLAYLSIGIIGFAGLQILLLTGLTITTSMNAAVIMALAPAMTMVGAAIFLGEAITWRSAMGLLVAVAGATLAVLGDSPQGLAGFTLDAGEPLIVLSALCLAFYTVASRKLLSTEIKPLVNITIVVVIGALALLVLVPFNRLPTTAPSLEVVGSLVAIAVVSTALAYLFWLRSTQVLGVDEPNLLFNFVPVLTIIISWVSGTPPYPMQIVGAALVLVGVSIAAWGKKGHHPHGHSG